MTQSPGSLSRPAQGVGRGATAERVGAGQPRHGGEGRRRQGAGAGPASQRRHGGPGQRRRAGRPGGGVDTDADGDHQAQPGVAEGEAVLERTGQATTEGGGRHPVRSAPQAHRHAGPSEEAQLVARADAALDAHERHTPDELGALARKGVVGHRSHVDAGHEGLSWSGGRPATVRAHESGVGPPGVAHAPVVAAHGRAFRSGLLDRAEHACLPTVAHAFYERRHNAITAPPTPPSHTTERGFLCSTLAASQAFGQVF